MLQLRATVVLIFVTVIWGLTFPLIHIAVSHIDPILFVFFRTLLASLAFLPFVLGRFRYTTRTLLLGGLAIAIFNILT